MRNVLFFLKPFVYEANLLTAESTLSLHPKKMLTWL
jgi:hypothetical protein